jgi:2-polyprenyl-6-methoxyphenol hydroxylase-like FAD-dependent oxidoreductase
VGAGITKAALDAECLADAIAAANGDLEAALPHYAEDRQRFGVRIVERARRLGAHLEAQLKPREQRTEAELHQRPEIVLREIGARLADIKELAPGA